MSEKRRVLELDSLRGIAALSVVLYHYTYRFNEKFEHSEITKYFDFPLGHYGVELFFLISGFVIFMSVNSSTSPLIFIKKRVIRLFPTYWVSMIFTISIVYALGIDELQVNFKEFFVNLTMIPSFFNVKAVDGVYWTLKIEWFFYLVIFFLLFTKTLTKSKYLSLGLVLMIFLVIIVFKFHPYFYYACLFIAGMNFYIIRKNDSNPMNHFLIFSLLMVSVLSWNLELIIVTSSLIGLLYLMIYDQLKFLAIKPLIFLGKISYALYLTHQNFGHSLQLELIEAGHSSLLILLIMPIVLSLIIAWLITYYVEIPLSKTLNRLLVKPK